MMITAKAVYAFILFVSVVTYSFNDFHSFIKKAKLFSRSSLTMNRDTTELSYQMRTQSLRDMLSSNEIIIMPCCYDGLSARIVEAAGFNLTFMTGFGVSAVHGFPDVGLLSSEEMVSTASIICSSLKRIPAIGDGDTGYGNVANVRRTVKQYIKAGLSGIMIEDQVAPKRCGHTMGKQVVDRQEAYNRIRAAVDIRNEMKKQTGSDIVILARTDARIISFEEAVERCKMFMELGADWTFLEAPRSIEEMIKYCSEVKGPKLANMLEGGDTPILSPTELHRIGYSVVAYPLTLLSASAKAMQDSLSLIKQQKATNSSILSFKQLQSVVGFEEYYQIMDKYNP